MIDKVTFGLNNAEITAALTDIVREGFSYLINSIGEETLKCKSAGSKEYHYSEKSENDDINGFIALVYDTSRKNIRRINKYLPGY